MISKSKMIDQIFDTINIEEGDEVNDKMSEAASEIISMDDSTVANDELINLMTVANKNENVVYSFDGEVLWTFPGTDAELKEEILKKAKKKLSEKDFSDFRDGLDRDHT